MSTTAIFAVLGVMTLALAAVAFGPIPRLRARRGGGGSR
jgi:hypothetical protein